ncbi:hypothetical protein, partial [Actinoplanes regularis]|uniref:hypothetical protein n=1 Tax=Actinoplanes regularis TaxID=52697 RepID=UPI0025532718
MSSVIVPSYQRVAAMGVAALLTSGLSIVALPRAASAAEVKPSACVREQADPVAARRMVDVCKAPVEILSERTEYAQLFLNPDGTSTLQESVEPQRVRQGKNWVPV